MYVCLCHGFTDREVRALPEATGGSTAAAFRALGVRPRCGKCVPMVKDIVKKASEGAPDPRPVQGPLPA